MFLHPAPGQKGRVTKRKILAHMQANGWLFKKVDADAITGIDDHIKSDLRSHKDFADILNPTGDRELVKISSDTFLSLAMIRKCCAAGCARMQMS